MSAETESISKWKEVASFPFKHFSQPFVINDHEFIIASPNTNSSKSNGNGIYKFDTHKNEWIKIYDYDKNFKCTIYSSTYDNESKLLYVCDLSDSPSKILTFDLKTKTTTTLKEEQYKVVFGLVFAENKLHQICNYVTPGGTAQNGDHYVYDTTKQFHKITTFESFGYVYGYALVYLKSQRCFLLFQIGYEYSVYRFSFIDSKWKELQIKIPIKVSRLGLVSTKNEQYIIILGGRAFIGAKKYSDDIFIYDTKNNIFTKSKVKCPKKGIYHAVMINNPKRDEMLIFGFINNCYKSNNLVGTQLLPQHLIQIICCYFCYEEIYLLQPGDNNGHWKINVDHILLSMTVDY